MPTAPETRKAAAAAGAESSVGHSARCAMSCVAAMPTTRPTAPPTRLSAVASTRNWSRMCPVRAPTARRTPISRVRSVTDTSMMFMIPIPRRLPLAGEDADHLERHVLHADGRADRIFALREELIDDRLAEDRHRAGARVVPLVEEPPRAERPVAHRQVGGRHPVRRRGP